MHSFILIVVNEKIIIREFLISYNYYSDHFYTTQSTCTSNRLLQDDESGAVKRNTLARLDMSEIRYLLVLTQLNMKKTVSEAKMEVKSLVPLISNHIVCTKDNINMQSLVQWQDQLAKTNT